MPKARRSAEDDEVARIIRRSNPLASSFRPVSTSPRPSPRASLSRGAQRPAAGRKMYRGYPVPAYMACPSGQFPGVVVKQMRGSADLHAVFICSLDGVDYLFNQNDSRGWDGLPPDGFHLAEYNKHNRPMMVRDEPIELSWNPSRGECDELSQHLSSFWHHPTHATLSVKQRRLLLQHMIAVCCGVVSTREFSDKLWDFELP